MWKFGKNFQNYTYVNTKPNYLTAFWNDGEERRCEECDEDLQQYFGLALLENHHAVTFENKAEFTHNIQSFWQNKILQTENLKRMSLKKNLREFSLNSSILGI